MCALSVSRAMQICKIYGFFKSTHSQQFKSLIVREKERRTNLFRPHRTINVVSYRDAYRELDVQAISLSKFLCEALLGAHVEFSLLAVIEIINQFAA